MATHRPTNGTADPRRMNPNWLGIASAILSFIAFLAVYRIAKDAPSAKRIPLLIFALAAAIPAASFTAYYAHILPEPSWYYQFRSMPGTELLIVFLGVAGGLAATFLPRVILILPLFGVAVLSIVPFIKPLIGPISADMLGDEWDEDVCLQSTPSTCGAASTATILKHFGVDITESELAVEAYSYSGGTEAWYLARAARTRGFEVEFEFSDGFSPESGLPSMVGVQLGSFGHFVPILGRQDEIYVVGDPLQGRELLSREALEKRYDFTGFHMRIETKPDALQNPKE